MIRFLLLISLLGCNLLNAGIDEHFKKIYDKEGPYQIENIDFIYLINLDQRPEKFDHCVNELSPYGIVPCRFSAVNGWELSLETINQLGIKYKQGMPEGHMATCYLLDGNHEPQHEIMSVDDRNYFYLHMSHGAIGIVMSHLSVLQDAYDSGYETVWIMEDDIQVIKNPHLISKMVTKLDQAVGKNNWDILFTDRDTKNRNGQYVPCLSYAWRPNFTPKNPKRFAKRKNIDTHFRKIGARYGAYSYIIRRAGMKKILEFIKEHKVFLPFDMDFYLPSDINLYTVRDDIVSTLPQALSDNGTPNYLNKEKNNGND